MLNGFLITLWLSYKEIAWHQWTVELCKLHELVVKLVSKLYVYFGYWDKTLHPVHIHHCSAIDSWAQWMFSIHKLIEYTILSPNDLKLIRRTICMPGKSALTMPNWIFGPCFRCSFAFSHPPPPSLFIFLGRCFSLFSSAENCSLSSASLHTIKIRI